jgi:hypothetical protein
MTNAKIVVRMHLNLRIVFVMCLNQILHDGINVSTVLEFC